MGYGSGYRRVGWRWGPWLAILVAWSIGGWASPAAAGPDRCGAAGPPARSPTWTDAAGTHWFDQHGLWTQAPDGSFFGGGGVDLASTSVQVNLQANNSVQAYVSPRRQCAVAGDHALAPNRGEFPIRPAPAIVHLPWLTRAGNLFKSSDGRTTILRGVDYPYNEEVFEPPYNLTDADFARIASWGFNLLRIRLSGYRSGYLPNQAPEPGYWEHLDHIIAGANRHGIYVLLAAGSADVQDGVLDSQAYDRLKFIAGTPDHAWWLAYESAMFARYRSWPGVVGFDTINEDDSYPPYIHDRFMMGPAHRDIDAALRARDPRHIYFQEPSGWSYWGAQYWPGMMNGVDIRDPNRFFCPKWKADGNSAQDVATDEQLAQQSNAPMFMCEIWITKTGSDGTVNAQQRDALSAMDASLIGGPRTTYPYGAGYGALNADGTESPWIFELARPYPEWVGGRPLSIHYDFTTRRLVLNLALNASGPTEIYTGHPGTYPRGFKAASSSGDRLVFDGTRVVGGHGMTFVPASHELFLRRHAGTVTVTIEPRSA